MLYINGSEMDVCKKVKYLGDIFNSKGNNNDLINDRVEKGTKCMISSMSLCSEITLGVHLIQTHIMMYKTMYLPVVLFNSSCWCNLTRENFASLATSQLKFLKRILHTPSSTANSITHLELGIIPMEFEIHKRQLQFLHHILTLQDDDPVKLTYEQQSRFEYECNWYNEVKCLRDKYSFTVTDNEIKEMSKEKWKSTIHDKIYEYVLEYLNHDNSQKSKTSHLPAHMNIKRQEYFEFLQPSDARLFFAIRSGTFDIKTLRNYNYDEGDNLCRLCVKEDETVDHIVNRCEFITRAGVVENVFSLLKEDVEKVVFHMKQFIRLADELTIN